MKLKKFLVKIFKRKKKALPTIYDTHNRPIVPIRVKGDMKIEHGFQRPSNFTKSEVDELLKNISTKKDELKLSPP